MTKKEKALLDISLSDLKPKHVSGYVLNDCKIGSDGAVYYIERTPSNKFNWDLYRCCELKSKEGLFVEIEKVGNNLSVEKLYTEIEKVEIYIFGYEAIALGLPYHIDPYGII